MSLQNHYASRLLRWTDTDRQVEAATFTALFERQVAATPDAVAVICEDVALTYSELDERAQRLACLLESRGAGPERCVALALPRDAELIVAAVAVLKAGAAFLPLDPDYPAARLQFMLADAGPDVVLSTAALAADLPAVARAAPARARRPADGGRDRGRLRRAACPPRARAGLAGVRDLHVGLDGAPQGRRRDAQRDREPRRDGGRPHGRLRGQPHRCSSPR